MSPCVSSRTQSKVLLKTNFSGGYVKRSRARSWEGAPPKKTSGKWRCSMEKKFKQKTSKVPEIKLVKLPIALIEKIHCSIVIVLINLYCYFLKNNSVTTRYNLFRLFSTGWRGKNELKNFSMAQLYYASNFNYVQLNYNNIDVQISLCPPFSTWLPTFISLVSCVSSRTHPKSRKSVKSKIHLRSWEGAPKKMYLLSLLKKSKKRENMWFPTQLK